MAKSARVERPTGTVTLLFTDIEGSTRLLQRLGAADYATVVADHHAIVRAALDQTGGEQHLELQRYRTEGHVGHGAVDLAGGPVVLTEEPEDFPAARRGNGVEDGGAHRHYLDQTKI